MLDMHKLFDQLEPDGERILISDEDLSSLREYGMARQKENSYKKALWAFSLFYAFDRVGSGVGQFFYCRGLMRESEERYEEALNDFEVAVNYDQRNPDYLSKVGEMFMRLGQTGEALNFCKHLTIGAKDLEIDPKRVDEIIRNIIHYAPFL